MRNTLTPYLASAFVQRVAVGGPAKGGEHQQRRKLLLVEVEKSDEIDGNYLRWIEKVLLKTFKEIEEEQIFNRNVGWLSSEWWEMKIDEIIRS